MKFTLSWLKDHLDTQADLTTIADTLTRIGLEVEHIDDPAAVLAGFVIAAVVEAKPHPNADRLRVCTVDAGGAPIQVVCGAPNARAGMRSVFSPVGTFIPGKKITLGAGNIRGVDSFGMLCSAAELELSDDHDGILDLPGDAPVGVPYARWAGLDDPVLTINLTPNRPDAMGVAGIARDLAAAGLGTFKASPVAALGEGSPPCPVPVRTELDDPALAPAFALRQVGGVANADSPAWLRARLRAIGLRPINALVDVTNYLAFDQARPLHVFDAAKVKGALVVRMGRAGESLVALDGKRYALDDATVVIADDTGPISIAGVMGGASTGCDAGTVDVLVESALWNPSNIAATGRRLGIVSDARYRFERGIDPAGTLPGLDRATAMILAHCGGRPSAATLVGSVPEPDTRLAFPESEVTRLTGLTLSSAEISRILEALGFELARAASNADTLYVKVPSFRPDVTGTADLVEEIVRIAGVDRVEPRPLPPAGDGIAAPLLTALQRRTRQAKRALAASGLVEAVTWSFVSRRQADLFGGGRPPLPLANPIAADLSDMRPSLLAGLVAAVGRNAARGLGDVALFEVGQVFRGMGDGDQRVAAAAIRAGTAGRGGTGRHWSGAAQAVDVFDAKADALDLLAALGVPTGGLQIVAGATSAFHPGRSMTLRFGPKNIVAFAGELHPRVLAAMDIAGPIVGFEMILDDIPLPKSRPTKAKPRLELPEFMPLTRDFAFIVDAATEAGDLVKAATGADKTMVAAVSVFDIYVGTGVPEGRKSVGLAATLQPRDRTPTDAEIEAVAAKIVDAVCRKTGAVLRG